MSSETGGWVRAYASNFGAGGFSGGASDCGFRIPDFGIFRIPHSAFRYRVSKRTIGDLRCVCPGGWVQEHSPADLFPATCVRERRVGREGGDGRKGRQAGPQYAHSPVVCAPLHCGAPRSCGCPSATSSSSSAGRPAPAPAVLPQRRPSCPSGDRPCPSGDRLTLVPVLTIVSEKGTSASIGGTGHGVERLVLNAAGPSHGPAGPRSTVHTLAPVPRLYPKRVQAYLRREGAACACYGHGRCRSVPAPGGVLLGEARRRAAARPGRSAANAGWGSSGEFSTRRSRQRRGILRKGIDRIKAFLRRAYASCFERGAVSPASGCAPRATCEAQIGHK